MTWVRSFIRFLVHSLAHLPTYLPMTKAVQSFIRSHTHPAVQPFTHSSVPTRLNTPETSKFATLRRVDYRRHAFGRWGLVPLTDEPGWSGFSLFCLFFFFFFESIASVGLGPSLSFSLASAGQVKKTKTERRLAKDGTREPDKTEFAKPISHTQPQNVTSKFETGEMLVINGGFSPVTVSFFLPARP